jgi:anti-sigma factor RsiW
LRGRIVASLRQTPARRPASARPFLWGAFSGAGATSLAAAVLMALLLPPTPSDFASGLAKAHSRALTGDKVVAVRSSDHHKVKPWLSRHAPLSPPVTDFAAQGFPLQGARVDVVKGRTLAVLAYARGAHEIDLYAWPTGGRPVPADNDHLGYHERFWTQGDLAFAAVSDVQADALSQFVALARRPGE